MGVDKDASFRVGRISPPDPAPPAPPATPILVVHLFVLATALSGSFGSVCEKVLALRIQDMGLDVLPAECQTELELRANKVSLVLPRGYEYGCNNFYGFDLASNSGVA